MANIVILGAGVMGSAFSTPLIDNNHTVSLVGTHLDSDIIEEVHDSRLLYDVIKKASLEADRKNNVVHLE